MKENLVPQEQSLVLKELGFDKKCWGVWINGRFGPRYKSKNSTFNPCQKLDKRNVDYCTAPTFEQAFDWFREKYNIHVSFKPVFGKKNYKKYKCNIYVNERIQEVMRYKFPDNPYFETYEEARLECLKRLIELSKN